MNKKIIFAAIALVAIFVLTLTFSKRKAVADPPVSKEILNVTVQNAADSSQLVQTLSYPALTAGDQQVTLNATVSGTITQLNFDLGSKVLEGSQLVVIDEIGNNSKIGEKGLKSSDVKALELEVESADEKLKIAKRVYADDKTYANKKARDIAEIDLQTAKVNLKGALNDHLAVSPISGIVTQKFVSQGDSVSAGQQIAAISKTALTKVQFYVDKNDLPNFKVGTKININEDGNTSEGIVSNIAPEADQTTKRFLIEAKPAGKNPLIIGSVINVTLDITRNPDTPGNLILPLSAITISQNESYIFIAENNHAKKANVSVEKVQGEYAEVKTDIAKGAQIIINGSKLVGDGEEIKITK